MFTIFLLPTPSYPAPAALSPHHSNQAGVVLGRLVGLAGRGRQPVARLDRGTSRIFSSWLPDIQEDRTYLEVDRRGVSIIVEVLPGPQPRATGRFWVQAQHTDGSSGRLTGPYIVRPQEWQQAQHQGLLDTEGIMTSHLRGDLLNLDHRFQQRNMQVGLARRLPQFS